MDIISNEHGIWLENTGNCSWQQHNVSTGHRDIVVDDFNEDGCADIVYEDESSNIDIRPGNCDGTFNAASQIMSSGTWLARGDFTEDGNLDLVINDAGTGNTFLYKGHGDGTFSQVRSIANVSGHMNPTAWDVNKDGHLDFVGVEHSDGDVNYFEGNGDGTFTMNPNGILDTLSAPLGSALYMEPPQRNTRKAGFLSQWFTGTKNWLNWKGSGGQPLKPVAQWRFDSGSGQIAVDSAGMDQNGTLGLSTSIESSDPAWTTDCRYQSCLDFDGGDDVIEVGHIPTPEAVTFTAWAKVEGSNGTWRAVGMQRSCPSSACRGWNIYASNQDNWQFWVGDGSWVIVNGPKVKEGEWVHLALVAKNGSYVEGYVNGEKVGRIDNSNIITDGNTDSFEIGGGPRFDGKIDDVRLYNRTLSPEQINALYHSPSQSWQSIGFQIRSRQSDPALSSLVASYSFEGTGQTVTDTSGNSNTGTLGPNASVSPRDAQRVSGVSGQGMRFDGVDDYVEIHDYPALDGGTGGLTLSGWIKTNSSTGYPRILSKAPTSQYRDTNGYQIDMGYGHIQAQIGNGSNNLAAILNGPLINDSRWHYVSLTWDGNNVKLFLDGIVTDSTTWSGNISNSYPFIIGAAANIASFFPGSIDEVRIYSKALTQNQVQQLYNLSEFTDPLTQEQGQYFDAPNTNAKGQVFEENYYQYKINFLTGDSSSVPQVEKVVMANASDWSPWFTDPSGNTLNIPDGLYAQIQTKFTSTAVLNTSVLHEIKLLSNFDPKIVATPNPSNSSDLHRFYVYAEAADFDGEGDIASCTLFYDDRDGNTGTVSGTINQSYGNSTEVQCSPRVDLTLPGIQPGETIETRVQFTDVLGVKVNTSLVTNIVPNRQPTLVTGPSLTNATSLHAFNVSVVAKDVDVGSSEISSCTVTHNDSSSTYATPGNLNTSYGTTDEAQCVLRIAAEAEGGFAGYVPGEQVSVQVKFTDKHGATVTTVQTSNVIPNRQPQLHPPAVRFPQTPEIFDDITVRVNTSDADDNVTYANFTIWEYNQDTTNRVYVNQNGTSTRNGTYLLWNSTSFQADLENATYNYSVTVSDGFETTTQSATLFTLKAVSPDVSPASFFRPSPWGLPATHFRPGQSVQSYVTVTDANGRGDIIGYNAGVSGPSTTADTSITVANKVLNGYNLSIFFSVPDNGQAGTWTLQTTATDEDTLQGSNSSTFQVDTYQDVTLGVNQSVNGTVYVDGENATQTVYTDSEVEFPYAVRTWNRLLTGVINYGRFQQLTVQGQRLTMTQEFQDSQFLLPATEASLFDLEELQGQFTGGLLDGRSFLDHAVASIGYGTSNEKTVRVAASFADDPDITLHGFNSSLSSGFYELAVRKTGVENGSAVVRVMR
ncbi:MAG: LamG-like jellyroll fold domain-containing protein [Candidatus Nanohaloarchaea archaeon]|nr:LamG-like jellyroll fold domain-containing protein [Candidatus Nanohaloarchaea archaeon]